MLKPVQEKNISQSQQNQRINAIKCHYVKVPGREKIHYEMDRPGRERILPDGLSREEAGAILRATKNPKHKCIFALIYSCGLRRRELINLKLENVDSKRIFRGSRIHWMILLEMMNENVNIFTQFGWICSIKSNDIKEINSMDLVKCWQPL